MLLIDNSDKQIQTNFVARELFYPDYSDVFKAGQLPFYCRKDIILALQFIRSYYVMPINITSFIRPDISQLFHYYGLAVDFCFNNNTIPMQIQNFKYDLDVTKPGSMIYNLLAFNVRGFGIGSNHVHLDLRCSHFTNVINGEPFCIFADI